MRLLGQTGRASLVTVGGGVGLRVAAVAKVLLLARMLGPAEIGAFALGIALYGIADLLLGHGLRDVLLVGNRPDLSTQRTVWTLLAVRGALTTIVLLIVARPLANLLGRPGLTAVLLCLALAPALRGVASLGITLAQRDLLAGRVITCTAIGVAVDAAVSVATARHLGATGLALGAAAGAAAQTVTSYPLGLPFRPVPGWAGDRVRAVLSFSRWRFVSSAAWYVGTSGDDALLGVLSGSAALGSYRMAWTLANTPPTLVSGSLEAVAIPSMAGRWTARGADGLAEWYLTYLRLTALVLGPTAGAMCVTAPALVDVVLGPNWATAAIPLAVLAVSGFARALVATAGHLFVAAGEPQRDATMQVTRAVVLTVCLVALAPRYGATGAAVASLGSVASLVPLATRGLRRAGLSFEELLRAVRVGLLTALATAAIGAALMRTGVNDLALLALTGTVGGLLLAPAARHVLALRPTGATA